jgi:hypothetical protein
MEALVALLDSRRLAEEILITPGSTLPLAMQEQLAVALSSGSGIAVEGHQVCVVLRTPLKACTPGETPFIPTVVTGKIPTENNRRRFRATTQVASRTVTCCKPGRKPYGMPTYAPVVNEGVLVGLSGPTLAATASIEVENKNKGKVTWRNLDDITPGDFVYFVEMSGRISFYQKVGPDHWILLDMDGTKDVVNIPRAVTLAGMHHPGDTVTAMTKVTGPAVFLRKPQTS